MGRTKEFDRATVLEQAMDTFWQRGYESTSIADLLDATGLSRSSLYDSFGDKDALFAEVLKCYRTKVGGPLLQSLEEGNSVKDAFGKYFHDLVAAATNASVPRGCLMIQSLWNGSGTAEAQTEIQAGYQSMEKVYREVLERGRRQGALSPALDLDAVGRLLFSLFGGIMLMSKLGIGAAELTSMVDLTLGSIFSD